MNELLLQEYKDVLIVEDIMEILHIGRNAAYKLIKDGVIRSIKIGKQYRIPKTFLLEYLIGKAG